MIDCITNSLYSPSSSRTAIHKTGIQILALDISPYRSHAVLAGREILKTIRVDDAGCVEDFNLRSRIVAYASTHNSSRDAQFAQHRDQLSAYDVKWSHGKFDTTIATAAANGRMVIYDLNSTSVEVARLHEHTRQVHRIAFNPYQGALLLSGSQDATIRMWDLRALGDERSVRTFSSLMKFQGNNESIRDLKWSPSDGVEFASGTDNGTVQRWDFRKENAPLMKLNAHEKTCHSIDWHPSGKYLASGGADKVVKVWNFQSSDRRMKPLAQLRTPQNIKTLRWRPSSTEEADPSLQSSESSFLATVYDAKDPRIHIWDFKRPNVPFQELDRYDTPATDILWHSADRLWSVGSAGAFTQTDLSFAPKPIERRNTNILATASDGTICAFFNERPRRRAVRSDTYKGDFLPHLANGSSDERFSSSQSANEGSLEEPNLLNSSLRKRRQKFMNSQLTPNRAPAPADTASGSEKEASFPFRATYESTQSAHSGHILGLFDTDSFGFLAREYTLPSVRNLNTKNYCCHETIKEAFESNAKSAEHVSQYRLAQSWRILGQATHQELLQRAQSSRHSRDNNQLHPRHVFAVVEPSQAESNEIITHTAGQNHDLVANRDDMSSMSTPLVRPMVELPSLPAAPEVTLNSAINDSGEPMWKPKESSQMPVSIAITSDKAASSENSSSPTRHTSKPSGPHRMAGLNRDVNSTPVPFKEFPDMEAEMQARRIAMSDYRAKPRTVLNLDASSRTLSVTPRLDRHDSEESFQMFSASADSDPRSITMPESFEDRQRFMLSESPEDRRRGILQPSMPQSNSLGSEFRQSETTEVYGLVSNSEYLAAKRIQSGPDIHSNLKYFPPLQRPDAASKSRIHVQEPSSIAESSPEPPAGEFLPSDFAPPASLQPNIPPWNICSLVPSLLDYHLERLSDVQLPSILALHLITFFPFLFPELQTSAYLLSYHQQLLSLQLYSPAAEFRKACELPFPDVTAQVVGAGTADWYCRNCNKPVKGESRGICRRCEQQWGPCPICQTTVVHTLATSYEVKAPDVKGPSQGDLLGLWTWCQGCGHGGHSGCLASWFADTSICEGTCPVVGCGHDCVEGPQREATVARIESEKSKGKNRSVIRDEWAVGESKAVERARTMVGETPSKVSGHTSGYRGLGGSDMALAASSKTGDRARAEDPLINT